MSPGPNDPQAIAQRAQQQAMESAKRASDQSMQFTKQSVENARRAMQQNMDATNRRFQQEFSTRLRQQNTARVDNDPGSGKSLFGRIFLTIFVLVFLAILGFFAFTALTIIRH